MAQKNSKTQHLAHNKFVKALQNKLTVAPSREEEAAFLKQLRMQEAERNAASRRHATVNWDKLQEPIIYPSHYSKSLKLYIV